MDDKNKINDELNDNLDEIAPRLSKLRKEEPFRVPADYFDDLASKILSKCDNADEIKEIAPLLSEIPKYNPFTVPGGYFDHLPLQVQEKCIETRRSSWAAKLAWLLRPSFFIPAAAAVIAVVIAMVLMKENSPLVSESEMTAMNVSYDSNSTDAITEDALLGMDDAAVLESLWSDPATDITGDDHYLSANEEDIIDYLLDNNTDISSIVTEL
jgi:hypothetical protein